MVGKPKSPTPTEKPAPDDGRPESGSGKGRRDVTGVMPDNIRVDPNITEGHPGYEESGESELTPPQQAKK